MAWYDDNPWPPVDDPGYNDPPIDFSPIPENPPPLIQLPLTVGPDVNSPDPSVTGGFDLTSLLKFINSGGSGASSLLKQLGLSGSGGGLDIGSLLGLLALVGGGINGMNATKGGGQDIKDAANASNATATDLFGKAQSNFAPYQAAGTQALTGLQTPQNLADKFVSKGTQSNMGGQFKGAMTLSQLAKR